ncbi:hypothetical protein MRX96_039238 [Rhipicephalus microplus]
MRRRQKGDGGSRHETTRQKAGIRRRAIDPSPPSRLGHCSRYFDPYLPSLSGIGLQPRCLRLPPTGSDNARTENYRKLPEDATTLRRPAHAIRSTSEKTPSGGPRNVSSITA